ncbi:hypothetical protein D3Z52_24885, partial [Clostridiaceae bacterium]|nr:hypothetical protein [Clostridiaceae bacterium]
MLKQTRTYTDYNGISRTEDFYFNLTRAEVTEMELSVDGGLVEMINRIVAAKDGKQIIALFKDIVLRAYGEKSPDGRRFIKTQEIQDAFTQTEAYSDLFMELATDAQKAAAFVNGIIPAQKSVASDASKTPVTPL